MSDTLYILPQAALTGLIADGIAFLKANPSYIERIFVYYKCPGMDHRYGQKYLDQIMAWWNSTPLPVKQAWSLNVTHVPSITIRLASENEDISREGFQDYWGKGEDGEIGISSFKVNLDIMLMGSKSTDEVLWLYHIVQYLLFVSKPHAEALGLQAGEFSATDFSRDQARLPDNVFSRSIRYTCSVQQFFDAGEYIDIYKIIGNVGIEPAGVDDVSVVRHFEIEDI
jgi:hypothetical protein